ncbi:hypothetical protein SAMN02927900_05484 [Rhizobium mongolense subsp. loessense]|uniref:Metallo-beta-lactamase superfamily protein n=1 Tax=Rhizobium mongolense subsp. loessense TaxID=158890 RepID=A0A1G4TQW7_9HYPH|nr:hypothetical protein [Rhizobium mongolense]SCW83738.1 hypothetical protein SAMN02927900_05484 [Rhizobium mongolense subsp. loessense]
MAKAKEAELKLELINVGHGDALVLHWLPKTGKPSTILIDGGPVKGAARVRATLDELNATAIDLAVLTHCDADHVDGLLAYVRGEGALPIDHYWGPCVPAFRRHAWLFPPRVASGIDKTEDLQNALPESCAVSWPVEGATWTSADGDLSLKVISPAGRLIERLLLGSDTLSLFLQEPMPMGWLLESVEEEPDDEDPYADLRFAISTSEITPDRIPNLPTSEQPASVDDVAHEAKAKGVDPEFFGNSVLNNTSIVLLVEARTGLRTQRLLLTGDLENFTYLMARYPMGLGCEIVKVPHHGSYSYIDSDLAYDEVWQWMRPRAALVSANGKHGLPRREFRDAALRYGTTLFCTSRRTREIVTGPLIEDCCKNQYRCNHQAPVSLTISSQGVQSEGIACARGNQTGVMPVIEVRQHTIDPSPILSAMAEGEIRKHIDWAVTWLRETLKERQNRPADVHLPPLSIKTLSKAASGAGRVGAATQMELILERAARSGKVWLSRGDRYRRDGSRSVWPLPNREENKAFREWIDGFSVIQLAVTDRHAGTAREELVYAADTTWLANRFAEAFAFPVAIFEDGIWPPLVSHLLKTRSIGIRTIDGSGYRSSGPSIAIILFKEIDAETAFRKLVERLEAVDSQELEDYLTAVVKYSYTTSGPAPKWPPALDQAVTQMQLESPSIPSGLVGNRYGSSFEFVGLSTSAKQLARWMELVPYGMGGQLPEALLRPLLASLILSGFEVLERTKPTRSP